MDSSHLIYTQVQELAVWHARSQGECPLSSSQAGYRKVLKKLFYMFDWEHFPELG